MPPPNPLASPAKNRFLTFEMLAVSESNIGLGDFARIAHHPQISATVNIPSEQVSLIRATFSPYLPFYQLPKAKRYA
jgi:hypothetical protein